MGFHNFIDPHRPFADQLNRSIRLLGDQDPNVTIRELSPCLRDLYNDYSENRAGLSLTTTKSRLRGFIEYAVKLGSERPTRAELDSAPELCRWCLVERRGAPLLLGHVLGHPTLRWGARARTSVLFQISEDWRWARTWGRYYLLNEYVPTTLFEMQADGAIGGDVYLVDLH